MSISTYSELKTAIARWLHRTDLTDDLDEIITLAENKLNSTLRLIEMETLATNTMLTTSRYLGYPSDLLELMDLAVVDDSYYRVLKYLNPEQMRKIVTTSSGEPDYYTIRGDLEFNCVPTTADTIEIHYIVKLALSDAAPTNNVLTEYPNIYLQACLVEAAQLVDDEKRISRHSQLLTEAVKLAEKRSKVKRGSAKARSQSELSNFSGSTVTTNNIFTGY